MRRWIPRALVVLTILVCLGVACLSTHICWLDGFSGVIGETFTGDTLFAPGYSEWEFSKIRPGWTREDVEMRLGKPLKIVTQDGCDFPNYTTWGTSDLSGLGSDCCWSPRSIVLKNGIVIRTRHAFYID